MLRQFWELVAAPAPGAVPDRLNVWEWLRGLSTGATVYTLLSLSEWVLLYAHLLPLPPETLRQVTLSAALTSGLLHLLIQHGQGQHR